MKNKELQQEVQELISNYCQTKNVSQRKLAPMIGISAATLTNIQNNGEKVKDAMLLRVRAFFKNPKEWIIVGTSNFTTIQNQCDKARYNRMMVGIIGYSGAGKTTSLKHYFEQTPNTYMVTCARAMRTKQFLSEILRSMGINYKASDFLMTRKIIEELNTKESPLLIIDEASKLSQNALMYLQDIWDGVEHNAGVIIAGVEYLLSNIEKWSDKGKIGMPEFFGRVYAWLSLSKPTKSEIKAICENNGLQDAYKIQQACNSNNFRQVRNIILA